MSEINRDVISEELACLSALIKEYGGVDSYTTTQATTIFELLCKMMMKLGLNPESRADFFKGACQIFNLEFVNMEDYEHGKYIFVPNHVSEFDGILFGTIVPNMLVVAKSDWVSNPRLTGFLEKLFSIVGIVRKDRASGMNAIRTCIDHLMKSQDGAVTIFVQQTIADVETTTPEDIAAGAYIIAQKADAKIVPVYFEQVSPDAPTRVVFGCPLNADKNDFGKAWLETELALRDSITDPSARPPILCEKHQKPISGREF